LSGKTIDNSVPAYASHKLQENKANALREAALQAMEQGLQVSSIFEPKFNGPSQITALDPRGSSGTKDSGLGKSKRNYNPLSDDDSEDEIVIYSKQNKKKSIYEGFSQKSTLFRTDQSSSNQTAMVLQAQNQRPNANQTDIVAPIKKQQIFVWETQNHSRSGLYADLTKADLAPLKRIKTEFSFAQTDFKNDVSMKSNIELKKYCEARAGNEYPVYINPNNEIRILEQIFPLSLIGKKSSEFFSCYAIFR
jgi:hypothetical protein